MKKRIISAICIAALLMSLTACGGEHSKTDTGAPVEPFAYHDSYSVTYTDKVTGYDMTFEAIADIPEIIYDETPVPVLRAEPEQITGEQAKKIAEALFGSAAIYEFSREKPKDELNEIMTYWNLVSDYEYIAANETDRDLTEEEIEEKIQQIMSDRQDDLEWTEGEYKALSIYGILENIETVRAELEELQRISTYEYISAEVREGMTPEAVDAQVQEKLAVRQDILDKCETLYNATSDRVTRQACEWTYYPDSHYMPGSTEVGERIKATALVGGMPYIFQVQKIEKGEDSYYTQYKENSIEVWIADSLYTVPMEVELLSSSGLFSDVEADGAELDAVSERVSEMIAAMDVGEWEIVSCRSVYYGGICPGYVVAVNAQPVYEGIVLTEQMKLDSLTSGLESSEYALNYNQESMEFVMSNDGRLIKYTYKAPLQVVETVEDAAEILSFDKLREIIKTKMSDVAEAQRDTMENQVSESDIEEKSEDKIAYDFIEKMEYMLSDMEIGYFRVNMDYGITDWTAAKESDWFYLIPAVSLHGVTISHHLDGHTSSSAWWINAEYESYQSRDTELQLIINLLDGSVLYPAS